MVDPLPPVVAEPPTRGRYSSRHRCIERGLIIGNPSVQEGPLILRVDGALWFKEQP